MRIASTTFVKMAIEMVPFISPQETARRREIRERRERERHAQWRAELRQQLFCGVRGIFIFLLGLSIVVFVLAHRKEINVAGDRQLRRLATEVKMPAATALRQSALDYEKEVDEASQGQ